MTYLLVAIGSALGGVARYWCSLLVGGMTSSVFPWGTLAVNVVGSGLIGVAFAAIEPGSRWQWASANRDFVNQFFMIGALGGFTTFSSFSLQTLELLRTEHWLQAGANVLGSLLLCIASVLIGYWLTARA